MTSSSLFLSFQVVGRVLMTRTLPLSYVQDAFVRKQTRGWKFYCPVCGGNDCWYTPDNAFAYCFNCGASFTVVNDVDTNTHDHVHVDSFIDVTPRDAYSLYSLVSDVYHKLLPDHARLYLHRRGVDDETIDTFALGYCPSTSFAFYHTPLAKAVGLITRQGKPTLQERITIPYRYRDVTYDIRGRYVGTALNAASHTYTSIPKHYTPDMSYPYNVDGALTKAKEYIIVTEGEFKAIVADRHGFPCVALPGMASYRPFPAELATYPIILVFDSQENHDDQIDAAMLSFIRKHPMKHIYITRLPLLGKSKMDIDTFLLHPHGGPAAFHSLLNSAIPWEKYYRLRLF